MCIQCDKLLDSNMNIDEIKKVPYIKVEYHEEKGRKWYTCYCEKCGNTRPYYL